MTAIEKYENYGPEGLTQEELSTVHEEVMEEYEKACDEGDLQEAYCLERRLIYIENFQK
jgi:hypothetical protein